MVLYATDKEKQLITLALREYVQHHDRPGGQAAEDAARLARCIIKSIYQEE